MDEGKRPIDWTNAIMWSLVVAGVAITWVSIVTYFWPSP